MKNDAETVLGRDEFESVIAQNAGLVRGQQSEAFRKHDGIYLNDSMQKMWVGYEAARVVLDAAMKAKS